MLNAVLFIADPNMAGLMRRLAGESHEFSIGAIVELGRNGYTAGRALGQVNSAKALCVRCTVRADCLSYALETRQHGIWGGTTGDERAAMLAISRRVPRNAVSSSRHRMWLA